MNQPKRFGPPKDGLLEKSKRWRPVSAHRKISEHFGICWSRSQRGLCGVERTTDEFRTARVAMIQAYATRPPQQAGRRGVLLLTLRPRDRLRDANSTTDSAPQYVGALFTTVSINEW